MNVAYFDCFSGIAGDMVLGALMDAGLPEDELRAMLGHLPIDGFTLTVERVDRHGLAATRVDVQLDKGAKQPHRHLKNVVEIIETADISGSVKARSVAVFRRLAMAEAEVHGTTVEKVHFHEVGAVDAIIDIVGAVWGLARLGVDSVVSSPIPTGNGSVRCEHGIMPVPAPATTNLLKNVPLAACDESGELTTPTGAAIATEMADSFGPMPAMVLKSVGVGAGSRPGERRPNIFRVLIGSAGEAYETDSIAVLEANVDDTTPETLGYVLECVIDAGALDAYVLPIQMKKSRPAALITVLTDFEHVDRIEQMLFAETTTFGVRRHDVSRSKLRRIVVSVSTRFGPIRVKEGWIGDRVITASPEFDDCRAAAIKHGVALREVMLDATRAWESRKS